MTESNILSTMQLLSQTLLQSSASRKTQKKKKKKVGFSVLYGPLIDHKYGANPKNCLSHDIEYNAYFLGLKNSRKRHQTSS